MNKLLIAGLLLLAPVLAAGQSLSGKPDIKVIVESKAQLAAGHPLAPDAVEAAIVNILQNRGYGARPLPSGRMSLGDTVIRLIYVVSDRSTSGGPLAVASGSVALLQRAKAGPRNLTLSRYQGVAQGVGYESGTEGTRGEVGRGFVDALREQINRALRVL